MEKKPPLARFSRQVMIVLPDVMRGFMRNLSDAVAKGKITAPQYLVMNLIDSHGAMKMSQLALELKVSLPAMSGLINRLYKMKFIRRIYAEKDRRIIKIELTAKGKSITQTIKIQRAQVIQKIFGQLKEQDRQDYLRVMLRIREILYKQ